MTEGSTEGVFSLEGQNLKLDTKEDIAPYIQQLEKLDPLHEVHLGGNTLGVGACTAVAEVLRTKTQLKVADFADIFTGRLITEIPDALRALCDALVEHTELQEINLSDNAFGGRSAEPMVNFLTHNHAFHTLKLSNNGLGVTGGKIVAQALSAAAHELESLKQPSQLRAVICGRNRLENGSAEDWAKAFAAHGTLQQVRMYQNGIRMEGVEALCKGLAKCSNLQVLDLQDNTVTLRGARAIAAAIPHWPQLRVLNLSDCLVKSKGGHLVFDALHVHGKSLEALHLQYCDLNRDALSKLGKAIHTNLEQLSLLEINGNFAEEDDDAIAQISEALTKWGHSDALDELDEMDPDGEEDEEDELLEEDDATENEDIGEKPDKEADALADEMAKTHIK
ncbi:Ran GAP Rna1 [Malassezia yamatoensis]|uniref:Ran GAP Rna1 n=1 Tax=Malassezia yamatoensis TaxID=253288 RepID=A0AAJ5YSJ0_9BASI|nr:Ran GAP Rna1 [Malassezia yamatoensis]